MISEHLLDPVFVFVTVLSFLSKESKYEVTVIPDLLLTELLLIFVTDEICSDNILVR